MPVNAFGVSKSQSSDARKKNISGAAIAGAGGTATAAGLAGGGVSREGKFDWNKLTTLTDKKAPLKNRADAARVTGKGGIFGFRIDAHEGGNKYFKGMKSTIDRNPNPNSRAAYRQGKYTGKIKAENKVIRQMKAGKVMSHGLAAAGLAAGAYGTHRMLTANSPKKTAIKKSQKSDRYSGAAIGAGASGAAIAGTSGVVLGRQHKKWKAVEEQSWNKAKKLVPKSDGVKNVTHSAGEVFAGMPKSTVQDFGELRGVAANARHFQHVYGRTSKVMGKLKKPALAAAGVGAVGVALGSGKQSNKKSKIKKNARDAAMNAFGVEDTRVEKKDGEYRPSVANKVPSKSKNARDIFYRKGTGVKRLKGQVKDQIPSAATNLAGGAAVGAGLAVRNSGKQGVNSFTSARGKRGKIGAGLIAAGIGASAASAALAGKGTIKSTNRELKSGDVKMTNRKTGKPVKSISALKGVQY